MTYVLIEVLGTLSRCWCFAPGPDVLTYEMLAWLDEGTAAVTADILQHWRRDMGDDPMPKS